MEYLIVMRAYINTFFKYKLVVFEKKHVFLCFSRSFQKLNNREKTVDPFKKKSYIPFSVESDSRNSNRICITILGNGGIGQPRCIGLFTEFKGYLFNCGEGVGRYCREYGVNIQTIKHVFVTQRKWENMSGLPDIYISNQTRGVYNMNLYGPPGVENFSYMVSSSVLDTRIGKKEGGYIDHTVDIDYIPIEKKTTLAYHKKRYFNNEPNVVYSYICKIHERPGDFLTEKCIENGVPIGPYLLKLKNMEDVILPCGKTVHAEDVHGPLYPEKVLLIVDCPSESFLELFVQEKRFESYQPPHNSSSVSVFHFTPSHVFRSQKYQDWMSRFSKDTQHFILNSDNPIHGSIVIHQMGKYFNLLHPKIFGKLREEELAEVQNRPTENQLGSKLINLPPMMQLHLRPKEEFSWCNVVKDEANVNITVEGVDIVQPSQQFYKKLEHLKSALEKHSSMHDCNGIYPEVIFLGTGSATSTAYRNVTSILVTTSPKQHILLDCGEGSMMQFTRYFGSDVYSVLRNLSCIFISHKHLDHYMGVFEILLQRKKAFEKLGVPYEPIAIILPFPIQDIIMRFSEAFQDLHHDVKLFDCRYLVKKRSTMKPYVGHLQISTVPVKHCIDSYGIVIESGSDWKIAYSGDTAPCHALVDAGKDCTLLIHEASIEDDMYNEALAKKHCTPSQVLDIAEKMNAQYTILTHFSKRYQGFPVLPESNRDIACAFDFMKVQKCDLPLLHLFTPVIKCLFEGHLQSKIKDKTSLVVNFENAFLKVLKS